MLPSLPCSLISVFGGKYRDADDVEETTGVNIIGNIELSEDEISVLSNNPKLAIVSRFDEENMDKELVLAATKVRWDMMNNPEKFENTDDTTTTDDDAKTDEAIEKLLLRKRLEL